MRPFSLPPGERTFQFLTGWVTRLLRLGGMETSGDDPTEIRDRIEDLYPTDIRRVKLMVVDEAWRYLKDPAVLSYLAEAAKTWRKKNAALIMATQSAGDVTGTPEAAGLLESMPTKIFLANPNLPEKVGEIFRLNRDEMETIRSLVPKMELFLKRAGRSAILRLEVDRASYWLYTSNPRDSERRAQMIAEHGLQRALEILGAEK